MTIELERPRRVIRTTPALTLLPPMTWPAPGQWTYEDYARLPDDGNRYEVIKGVLYMTPSPTLGHQQASAELEFSLMTFVKQHHLGLVLDAPFDVILPGVATPVQPDLLFVRQARIADIVTPKMIVGAPDLVVEISSPGTARHDRLTKYAAYEEAGVPELWLVDPARMLTEVYSLENGAYRALGAWGQGEVATSAVLPGWRVAVDEVCASPA